MQKPKYITNKDLLREIHRSKVTFCVFTQPEFADYDVIVSDLENVTPELLAIVLDKKQNPRGKIQPTKTFTLDDIVIRLMTHEHIPLDPDRKRKARNTDVSYARTNFPPFKHYVARDDKLIEVGRSHWKGDLETGEFCLDKGRLSNSLAIMFMMLVERYARRGNWRGYCYDQDTELLTKRGWLRHDEMNLDDTILSYDCNAEVMKWSRIKSIYRDQYEGNMFHLTSRGMDALVTPGHKFIVKGQGLKKAEYLLETDRLVLMGEGVEDTHETYPDSFVELVGWTATEGNFYKTSERTHARVSIYQNLGPDADRIRDALNRLGYKFNEYNRKCGKQVCFTVAKQGSIALTSVLKTQAKVLTTDFIMSLSKRQRIILIDTMVAGDGWIRQGKFKSYTQKDKDHVDAFRTLCGLAGIKTSSTLRDSKTPQGNNSQIYTINLYSPRLNVVRVENVDFHGAKRNGLIKGRGKVEHPNEPTVPYSGTVWCPQTEYGTVMCRRNDHIFLGSNTYVDEMRSHALLQLSQVGLQFDESKGDNPFAFFTTTIHNCFTRVLNVEKKNQNIRDDMLIVAGVAPSYTRQIDNELEQRYPSDHVAPARPKRGAPRRKVAVKDHDALV